MSKEGRSILSSCEKSFRSRRRNDDAGRRRGFLNCVDYDDDTEIDARDALLSSTLSPYKSPSSTPAKINDIVKGYVAKAEREVERLREEVGGMREFVEFLEGKVVKEG